MKHCSTWMLLLAFSLSIQVAVAQLSGTRSIPGDYPNIGAALADIQASGLSGHLILELRPNYWFQDEPSLPLVIPENFPTSANATVTLRPSIGASGIYVGTGVINGFTVPPTGNVPIFDIYGSYFNIDGRAGGAGTLRELIIWSSGAEGSAIQFSNNASNNKVSYCHLTGTNNYANPFGPANRKGVVTFNPEGPFPVGVLGGTRNNTVEHNLIEGAIYGGGINGPTITSPFYSIYAKGNADAPNINNTIIDNDIINFTYSAIEIATDGPGASWIIKNNSFYSTLTEYTYPQYAINILHGTYPNGTNIIEGNFIGGNAPLAAGKWRGGPFFGIVCNSFAGGDSLSVRNNMIKNIEKINPIPYPDPNPFNNDVFAAISITNAGAPNKVDCSNNFIGGPDGEYGISVTANATGGDAAFYGILLNDCNGGTITQNTIQNIRLASVESSTFSGIKALVFSNAIIAQNTIQQLDVQSGGDVRIYNISITDEDPSLEPCSDPSLAAPILNNNTITAVTGTSSGGAVDFAGITINGRLASNKGNIIGSETVANSINLSGVNAVANGVLVNGFAENVAVSNDIIANIKATGINSSAVNGVQFNGAGTVTISGNNIYNLNAATVKGILIKPTSGNTAATITGNSVKGVNASFGTGVEANIPATSITNLVATDNTVNTWQAGFLVTAASGSTLTQTVQGNSVTGNQTGYINQSSSPQNATCNWWGSASGPSGEGPGTGDPVGPNVIFSPWATTPAFVAVNAGADQTIYIGYGPTSKTIAPAYTVCGSPTYLWSTGATTPTITVSPTITTTYIVTLKDANGHTAADTVIIIVKDIRCGNNKVTVCHKESATKKKTLCINTSDVAMHLAHGDALGECTTAESKFAYSDNGTVSSNEVKLYLYPNPASNQLTLQWAANQNGLALIKITDMTGRQLLQQTFDGTRGNNQKTLPLKGMVPGSYILIMQADGKTHTVKFVVGY
ncbi:T9SS type A sorting domain-containing protein [Flavihumibacter fluvii]|uniref:T9SS type A sorting domain-containing protein n=1 Tax=Flavihumibacter fluvii TaxID=2838157 RepID=UPI001BDF6876|nr:T9SS type A sorting domain-containing protein [Flavihumibacter fluvii]ULQ53382.1 T9SS type A sorting domain-containing protein [Flavihumibacter fluvii]